MLTEDSCLLSFFTLMLVKCWFSSPPTASTFISQPLTFICSWETHLLSFFISVLGMDLFIQCFIVHCVHNHSLVEVVLDLASGSPFSLAPMCPFDLPLPIFFFGHFIPFWYNMAFPVCLVPTPYPPSYQPFLQRVLVPFSGKGRDLGIRCGHCFWGDFASWPCTEQS